MKFSNILLVIILDHDEFITDLGYVVDSRTSFAKHIDDTFVKVLAMLRFVKRLSGEFKDPYTLRIPYVSLVRLKLETCTLIRLVTLGRRRSNPSVMFVFKLVISCQRDYSSLPRFLHNHHNIFDESVLRWCSSIEHACYLCRLIK
jgi:hypothetical protein